MAITPMLEGAVSRKLQSPSAKSPTAFSEMAELNQVQALPAKV
jgi:hypothetical protein